MSFISLPVAQAGLEARRAFLTRTYLHLFAAIGLFTAIEAALFSTGLVVPLTRAMLGVGPLLLFGGFVLVSWIASAAAFRAVSPAAQYGALVAFVVMEAIWFAPMLLLAAMKAPGVISSAAGVTLFGFALLTGMVMWTKQDLHFLGGLLRWLGIMAFVLIVASLIFGFELGTFFSVAMVGFAGAVILYETSEVLHRFPEGRHVAASLQLFSSVALMFWYVLRLFLGSRR